MPRKPKTVPLSKIDDIQTSLKQKAATPKTISLEELILNVAKPIQDMLDAGYDYQDVSDVFKGHGVELAASSIKSFHKKALSTTANNSSDSSAVDSQSELNETLGSTADDVSPDVDDGADGSLSDAGESLSDSSPKTTKTKKSTAKASSQFNITDRSEL